MKYKNQYNLAEKKSHSIIMALIILCFSFLTSCNKFEDVPPPKNQLVSATVFINDATATSAVVGIYSNMVKSGEGFTSGNESITSMSGLSCDELLNYSGNSNAKEFYANSLDPNNTYNYSIWEGLYQTIYDANSVLDGLAISTGVDATTKQQLQGEALFIRSFCLFYLTNLYGDVPLITTTNYEVNDIAARTPQSQIYQQIIADLNSAQSLLSDTYITSGRIRPNKSTATALLARVYLYTTDWKDAALQAANVISDAQYSLTTLSNAFLANNSEAIWQIEPVLPGYDTFDGYDYILKSAPTLFSLSTQLVNSFEPGDNRATSWISNITVSGKTYYFPYKYKVKTGSTLSEYFTIFRLAEQYLIRSEAEAEQKDTQDAITDLNVIRNRAGLPAYTGPTDQASVLTEIMQENQHEFFVEWGHRWLDLKRTNEANSILPAIKGSDWQVTDQLYPIPQADINADPKLTQNTGY